MATTVSYTASMITRKTNLSSNFKSSVASQEYYVDDYNLVGVIHFAGMNLTNKVISSVQLTVSATKAGYGASNSKIAFLRKSNYQSASASGVTG